MKGEMEVYIETISFFLMVGGITGDFDFGGIRRTGFQAGRGKGFFAKAIVRSPSGDFSKGTFFFFTFRIYILPFLVYHYFFL